MNASTFLRSSASSVFVLVLILAAAPVIAEDKTDVKPKDPVAFNQSKPAEAQRELFGFLRVEEAWGELGDAEGCTVGILDAGFDFFHPCLDGRLQPTFFAGGVYHLGSSKLTSHGTGMASLIAAQRVDKDGMIGMAPKSNLLAVSMGSALHLPLALRAAYLREHPDATPAEVQEEMQSHAAELQAFGREWVGSKIRSAAEGLTALVDHGARVINFSAHFGAPALDPEFKALLDKAYAHAAKHDVLVVVSAGNTGTVETVYFGTPESVLVVGASLLTDELWEQEWKQGDQLRRVGSCTGPRLSVVAPVQKMVLASPHAEASYQFKVGPHGDESAQYSGDYAQVPRGATSQAAPVVTSLAALIRSAYPDLNAKEVIDVIQQSSVDLGEPGRDDRFGHGRIDFLAAMQLARQRSLESRD
ncbi:MAG: S8 family serine peptidase [Planctomycetota bacterium]